MDNKHLPFKKLSIEQQHLILKGVGLYIHEMTYPEYETLRYINTYINGAGLALLTLEELEKINKQGGPIGYEMECIATNTELTLQDLLNGLSRILISQQSDTDKVSHIKELIRC